jgi:hypothetical protein
MVFHARAREMARGAGSPVAASRAPVLHLRWLASASVVESEGARGLVVCLSRGSEPVRTRAICWALGSVEGAGDPGLASQRAVLRRRSGRPRIEPADRALLATLSRALPRQRGRRSRSVATAGRSLRCGYTRFETVGGRSPLSRGRRGPRPGRRAVLRPSRKARLPLSGDVMAPALSHCWGGLLPRLVGEVALSAWERWPTGWIPGVSANSPAFGARRSCEVRKVGPGD